MKKKVFIFLIFTLGIFLRFYDLPARFMYNHDHDLASWIVKDILVNKHLRLIGQETSTPGIFIGPLYYYALVPFYLVFQMDPIANPIFSALFGFFGIFTAYFVFQKMFGKTSGLTAAFLYSVSFFVVANDREAVPTMPVIIWSVWFLYALNLILQKKQKDAFLLLGILVGLIWHLNMGLVIALPLVLLALLLAREKPNFKAIFVGAIPAIIFSIPLILFETRHDFIQARALLGAVTTNQQDVVYEGLAKFGRVAYLLNKNFANFLWGDLPPLGFSFLNGLLGLAMLLFIKKKIGQKLFVLFTSWLLLYFLFFGSYSKIVSEYYLNGVFAVFLGTVAVFFASFLESKKYQKIGILLILIFLAINLQRFFTFTINRSGYLERKAIVAEIKNDATTRNYPCLAVSFITAPGNDLGYRYLFWLQNLNLKRPGVMGVPVYSIVFPHNLVDEFDRPFGALALIYPPKAKDFSCIGPNILDEPLFGYTD